jgi:hypothetical protein
LFTFFQSGPDAAFVAGAACFDEAVSRSDWHCQLVVSPINFFIRDAALLRPFSTPQCLVCLPS